MHLREHDETIDSEGHTMSITDVGTPERPSGTHLLTIDEAANYLAIPKATLYTWRTRRAGFGPRAVKIGGCLRFRRSDLDAWIDAHVEQPDSSTDNDLHDHPESSRRGKAPSSIAGLGMTRRRHTQI